MRTCLPRKEEENIVLAKRARLYDALALLTAIVIIVIDQWTKALVVQYLSPPYTHLPVPLIGNYLSVYYIQNSGAAFGLFANTLMLAILIVVAICVISYLYVRNLNTATLAYKLIFGMIIGGALGNLIDRALHSGYVVDFIYFQIPEIHYHFAIFNIADASISVGVFLLFVFILFGGTRRPDAASKRSATPSDSSTLRSTEQDAQP